MLSKEDILLRMERWNWVESHIHQFFREHGFVYVRTPILVSYPDLSPNLEPLDVSFQAYAPNKKTIDATLITSPELSMKKILASGIERIYTMTPVFRGGEALEPHNTPEFTMLEWYHPADYEEGISFTREFITSVLDEDQAWPAVRYEQANVDTHGDPHIDLDHFFLTEYPTEQAALARLSEDKAYAERFEVFADGIELCNGFCELLDAHEQKKRFEYERWQRSQKGSPSYAIDTDLLEAIDQIQGPVCGVAMGVDRLLMLKYGVSDINDTQIFPARERFSR